MTDVFATDVDGKGHFLLGNSNMDIYYRVKESIKPDFLIIRTQRCHDVVEAVRVLRSWGAIE